MKTIHTFRSVLPGDNQPDGLRIEFTEDPPDSGIFDRDVDTYRKEADIIVDALFLHAPASLVDFIVSRLLMRRASITAAPYAAFGAAMRHMSSDTPELLAGVSSNDIDAEVHK